jgi:hypothetical protein
MGQIPRSLRSRRLEGRGLRAAVDYDGSMITFVLTGVRE